jgi:hypothetical protein
MSEGWFLHQQHQEVLCHGDKGPTYRKEYEQNAMKK